MRTHIDWLTFTLSMRYSNTEASAYAAAIENAFDDTFDVETRQKAFGWTWEVLERSRAPYVDAWAVTGGGITLFASPDLTHCCVEISGQGCERMIEQGVMNKVLALVAERVTRIDIACDMLCDETPIHFVGQTSHERMRSSGYQKSETGETCYIGSQKSERYARVYRYANPHPRSHLLRAEHVFRRKEAKNVARYCVVEGAANMARSVGNIFGWNSSNWQPENASLDRIGSVGAERKMGKTVFWLIKACAPAFRRLVNDGTISDPEGFINTYFLGTE